MFFRIDNKCLFDFLFDYFLSLSLLSTDLCPFFPKPIIYYILRDLLAGILLRIPAYFPVFPLPSTGIPSALSTHLSAASFVMCVRLA